MRAHTSLKSRVAYDRFDWCSASPDALREGGTMLKLDWRDAHESLLLTAPTLMIIVMYVRHEAARRRELYSPGARRPWSCAAGRKLQNQRLANFQNRFRAVTN